MNKSVFILLAGGKSQRMGVAKGLLKYQQTFWILEQLNRIALTNIKEVSIGLGYNYQLYFNAISWFEEATSSAYNYHGISVKIYINKKPELGPFSTLQTILKNIALEKSIIVNPIDVPILNSFDLQKIADTNNHIVIPTFETKKGHPVKIDKKIWNPFLNLNLHDENSRLDRQLKKISNNNITKIKVSDASILLNLNTVSRWKLYLNKMS